MKVPTDEPSNISRNDIVRAPSVAKVPASRSIPPRVLHSFKPGFIGSEDERQIDPDKSFVSVIATVTEYQRYYAILHFFIDSLTEQTLRPHLLRLDILFFSHSSTPYLDANR